MKLKQYRKRLGLTQSEMAERVGLSINTYRDVENHRLSIQTLKCIALFLGVDTIKIDKKGRVDFDVDMDIEKLTCDVCGSGDVIEVPHMGRNCNWCFLQNN
jgi:transcriptional regulator with XRE-family HTH domain